MASKWETLKHMSLPDSDVEERREFIYLLTNRNTGWTLNDLIKLSPASAVWGLGEICAADSDCIKLIKLTQCNSQFHWNAYKGIADPMANCATDFYVGRINIF